MSDDTIVAISTAAGPGAIGIVRLSGPSALELTSRVFVPRHGDLFSAETFSLTYGHVVEPDDGTAVDEVLVAVMRAPRSYTREDVVEVHCHGGPVALRTVLRIMVASGARIAEPGEFTRRAFVNGRIDLAQAEGIVDLISARSRGALRAAMHELDGGLSSRLKALRGELVSTLAGIEASVDFSEEDVDEIDWDSVRRILAKASVGVEELLSTAGLGRVLQQGVRVAIVGRPNVGKSSLLNALVMRERAIVSEIPGTTRDTVEEEVDVGGIPIRLVDTAGIRSDGEAVERLGMERSLRTLEQAELVIVVADLSDMDEAGVLEMIEAAQGRPCIVVGNKSDLVREGSDARERLQGLVARAWAGPGETVAPGMYLKEASAKTGEGVAAVRRVLEEVMAGGSVDLEEPILVGERQRALVCEAGRRLADALAGIDGAAGEELVAEDVRGAALALGRITGEDLTPDLLDEIFSRFCLGK